MTIEVRGRAPGTSEGERYAADDDQWEALLYVLHEAGTEVPPEWADTQGAGPASAEQAADMAARLERYLEVQADDKFFVGARGKVAPPYGPGVSREAVQEFASFLRASGGFELQ